MIKELIALGMGVSIIARSVCREEERQGKPVVLPMENANWVREINMVYHKNFSHMEILGDLQQIYRKIY